MSAPPVAKPREGQSGRSRWVALAGVCALVIGVYAALAHSGPLEAVVDSAADTQYNLLVQGFRAGHLSLPKAVPAEFARLPDPYDPEANFPFRFGRDRLLDLSYYKGRLYLYFGVTPALVLFWPYAALTGHYLFHRESVVIFGAVGFLTCVGVLLALWRRYFAEVSFLLVLSCVLALGLATGLPVLLTRCEVYEVAIACGSMFVMLALGALWQALHDSTRRCRWLAVASAAYGLAVGARPILIVGAGCLLVPVWRQWHERRSATGAVAAALAPILLIGAGLLLYNFLRFEDPLEFGFRYALTSLRMEPQRFFVLRHVGFNARLYFLQPARWSFQFPFVREAELPPMSAGHGNVDRAFGILVNVPLAWFAVATLFSGRNQPSSLRSFVFSVTGVSVASALLLCAYFWAATRYEVEFLPELILLACMGFIRLDHALICRTRPRYIVRCVWGLLLVFSIAFNLLAGVVNFAEGHCHAGNVALDADNIKEATIHYEAALRLKSDFADAHCGLGAVRLRTGDVTGAVAEYEQALRLNPELAEAHNRLGIALLRAGRLNDAIAHFTKAVRIKPGYAEARFNLGFALEQVGHTAEAIEQYEHVLRLKPDLADVRDRLQRLRSSP